MNNQTTSHSHQFTIKLAIFVGIVLIGIASRFWLVDMPNFKPVAGLVLFAGFFFRRWWPAVAALFAIMIVSDLQLGVYDWKLAATVYASLAAACGLGMWVKSAASSKDNRLGLPVVGGSHVGRFAIASIAMSTVFFLLTNCAVWMMGWYPGTWSGLVSSYIAGLPFFRATLLSNLLFTGVLVFGYAGVSEVCSRLAASKLLASDLSVDCR
ncbi:MAG: DUF6580 family putative transport protein [Mariniblastus sp.]